MRALVFENQELRSEERPRPEPEPGEALVRVLMAGICNTDLEIVRGYMGFTGILGHEFVGIVEQSSRDDLRGQRVVGEINCPCRVCPLCARGLPHHCPHRTVLGIQRRPGALAQYLCLPEQNLYLVPRTVSDDEAVFVEPLAAAFRILEQVDVRETDHIVVLGDGKLAQLIAQVLWMRTRNLVCLGHHEWKLDLLRARGIAVSRNSTESGLGADADLVVDATGSADGLREALGLVRPEGTVVLKTTAAEKGQLDMAPVVINDVTILGSRCGPFAPALQALAAHEVEVRPLISATYPFEAVGEAFEHASRQDAMKILLEM